ncbi:MAG: hemolysin III family protein [Myxococcota bacterium]|jgi:hemolysin III|nr:hemolysin III family protein [Myxococcota bacterium]
MSKPQREPVAGNGVRLEAPLRARTGIEYNNGVDQPNLPDLTARDALRPKLRGVFHLYAFFVALGACATLLLATSSGTEFLATLIYSTGLCGVLGISALYHRIDWAPRKRVWMRRLDHSMIFVLIAGSYTPFPMLVLPGPIGSTTLTWIWLAALGGLALKLIWIQAPDWLAAAIYVAVGSLIVPSLLPLLEILGTLPVVLLGLGGLLYIVGALIFALQRPDPAPDVFGYHEIFHLCVIAAAVLHFVVIAYWVVL